MTLRDHLPQSRFEEARTYGRRVVDAEPGNYAAHAILGRVLVSLDRPAEGVRELERAMEIEPGSPQIYFALASAYARLGAGGCGEGAGRVSEAEEVSTAELHTAGQAGAAYR